HQGGLWCLPSPPPRPPTRPPVPSTTLFRSHVRHPRKDTAAHARHAAPLRRSPRRGIQQPAAFRDRPARARLRPHARQLAAPHPRSEEHTSELQSRENLVCRLLLEKKNGNSR